jgi:hypothetical protein
MNSDQVAVGLKIRNAIRSVFEKQVPSILLLSSSAPRLEEGSTLVYRRAVRLQAEEEHDGRQEDRER